MSELDDLFDGHYFTEDPHVYIPIDEAQQELAELRARIAELEASVNQNILDTGGGCAVCGEEPVVWHNGDNWLCNSCLCEIVSGYGDLIEQTTWQPIETAPIKPEGDYLGFQCGEVFKMYWNYFRDGWVDCYSEVFSEPSHWMPLPKPPEEK